MIKPEYVKDFEAAKALFKVKLAQYQQRQQSKEGDSGHSEGQTEGEGAEEEEDEEPKPPAAINVRRITTYRLWKAQTDDFRTQVAKFADDAHDEAVAEWEEQKKRTPPKSAEQYDW